MKKLLLIVVIGLYAVGCKKDSAPPVPPGLATLILPARNEICASGTVVSPSQTSVLFSWQAAANADSYEIGVKNLLNDEVITTTSSTSEVHINLTPGIPYSWYVVSLSSGNPLTTKSESWKFYLSAPGVTAYAPFPAEIVSPSLGQVLSASSGKITLMWTGSDVDNDISNYDVYFGPTANPGLIKSNQIENRLVDVIVTANTTYYWKVITRDSKGNTSDSGLYQFKNN